MDSIHVRGGNPLFGETKIQGSKNAVLPIMAAALLVEGVSVIENCPKIADVDHMQKLLAGIGCVIHWRNRSLYINAENANDNKMNSESVGKMRSSIMLLGAMLGRFGKAVMNYPGGCVIGARPIDIHLNALGKMGVTVKKEKNYFTATSEKLTGTVIELPSPSVGASENVILAAINAEGITTLRNAAPEPEIVALCDFLKKAGAKIDIKTEEGKVIIVIQGGVRLNPVSFRIPADRIVAGTYMLGVLGAGGHVFLKDAPASHMRAIIELAREMNADVNVTDKGIAVLADCITKPLKYLETDIYPLFPTDLQSQLLSILTIADGESVICEKIFEDRLKVVPQLRKMGADISISGNIATIRGVSRLKGTKVKAKELRGGAALVIAGIIAEGNTIISKRQFIERGYEDIARDFRDLGVIINNV
ncbi:MAG: UDP-N-acetylglucosamine 1-carboxyvinyltransferase [Lachnospiraceae bacterium]|nr:UDP-N-acetylglucosamine 1-carboxyvinyltransferase [Lachnospiraceae bacterium]